MINTQDLQEHRSYFPALNNKAYFNFGGQGTLPKQAVSAIFCSYDYVQTNGPFSLPMLKWLDEELSKTKEAFAQELNVDKHCIALTQSVTEGCNIVLWGTDWKAGDHLIMTDCEHPSLVAVAEQIAKRFEVQVSLVQISDPQVDVVKAIGDAITPKTKMVALSHVLWNTGALLPIAQIAQMCRARNVKLLVDGAQSAGVIPLDLQKLDVDFYAITAHKWFCGPEGVGALYVRPELLEELLPTFVGWRGIEMIDESRPDAARFEVATCAFPLLAGVRAALEVHREWGSAQKRFDQIKSNLAYLKQKLAEIKGVQIVPCGESASLVAFSVDGVTPSELVRKFEAERVMLRTLPFPRSVRASVHYFTDKRDMDRLIGAIGR